MADLPSSWGLKTKRRGDGKLDIVGKDDTGHEYRARITDTPEVTEKDIQELKKSDRESYANPKTRVWEYMDYLMDNPSKKETDDRFLDDLTEAAGPVVHAGLERKGSTLGSTAAYRRGWDRAFGEN